MIKEEAQIILDNIDSKTVIDYNWLGYLIDDKECKVLRAISIITDLSWNDFLEKYEGDYISNFQTKKVKNYIGRIIKLDDYMCLILGQTKTHAYYIGKGGNISGGNLKDINKYLV